MTTNKMTKCEKDLAQENEKMDEHAKHDMVKVTKNKLDFHEDENECKDVNLH